MLLVLFPEHSLTSEFVLIHPLMNVREIARGLEKQRSRVHTPEAMNLSILSF
jgi:hypothetical protein